MAQDPINEALDHFIERKRHKLYPEPSEAPEILKAAGQQNWAARGFPS